MDLAAGLVALGALGFLAAFGFVVAFGAVVSVGLDILSGEDSEVAQRFLTERRGRPKW